MSWTYVIIDADEIPQIDFSLVGETSAATLRYNTDEDQTFVKYKGAKPRFLYGKTSYTHTQILTILATSAWNQPPDED